MSFPIKWQYDITGYLDVEILIEENIKLHRYFKTNLKINNLFDKKINLFLEIEDFINENNLSQKFSENNM
jgi:hypothetical protein